MEKSADAFRTISEVSEDLSVPQHVLRFWETRFPQVRPLKRAGGRRYYRPADVLLLRTIRQLLYDDGYTIKGVQRLLKEQGAKGLGAAAGEARPAGEPGIVAAETPEAAQGTPPVMRPGEHLMPEGDPMVMSDAHRRTIEDALAAVEDCERLLAALRRPLSVLGA